MYRAIIPVKALGAAKSRLSPHLTPSQRASLMLEMLQHVIGVLQASQLLEAISVVSSDRHVLEQVRAWGAETLPEEAEGHNSAAYAAALREMAAGATALLTISADLPLLNTQDVKTMIQQSRCYDVVLAPSREGTGTNALLVHPPLALPYLFGQGSLQRYLAEARRLHLSSTLYQSTNTALDIDTIEDLKLFHRLQQGRDTMSVSPFLL